MDFTFLSLVPALNPSEDRDLIHGWRFDKTINVPFIIGVIGVVAAGSMWVASIDQRMARVEDIMAEVASQHRLVDRLDVRVGVLEEQVRELKDPHFDDARK